MKSLVNPLFWYLLLQVAGLAVLMRRKAGRMSGMLLALTLLLAAASTPWARFALETSLRLQSVQPDTAPAFIFVLGGGYFAGQTPAEDILTTDSQRRVLQGVAVWRRYPNAHLVFSGTEVTYAGVREPDRLGRLMAQLTRDQRVPDSAILLEPRSRNTHEHPVAALALPGVNPELPIAVVTSAWHARRAHQEFCRYFAQVQVDSVPAMTQPKGWEAFLPDPGALNANTALVREWVGMLWYSLRGVTGPAAKC